MRIQIPQEAALAWQGAVLQSLREVSDALVAYQRQREVRATQEALVVAATDARPYGRTSQLRNRQRLRGDLVGFEVSDLSHADQTAHCGGFNHSTQRLG